MVLMGVGKKFFYELGIDEIKNFGIVFRDIGYYCWRMVIYFEISGYGEGVYL